MHLERPMDEEDDDPEELDIIEIGGVKKDTQGFPFGHFSDAGYGTWMFA